MQRPGERKREFWTRLAIAAVLASMNGTVIASVRDIELKELIGSSDLIVVARVTKIEAGPERISSIDGHLHHSRIATAEVIETWKGVAVREVRYNAFPSWQCNMSWAYKGERVLLLLEKSSGLSVMSIAWSGRGRMPIQEFRGKCYVELPTGVYTSSGTPTIPTIQLLNLNPHSSHTGERAKPWFINYQARTLEFDALRELAKSIRPKDAKDDAGSANPREPSPSLLVERKFSTFKGVGPERLARENARQAAPDEKELQEAFEDEKLSHPRFVVEDFGEFPDPCESYPMIGPIRLIHRRFQCTASEADQGDAPKKQGRGVVFIDREYLAPCQQKHPHPTTSKAD